MPLSGDHSLNARSRPASHYINPTRVTVNDDNMKQVRVSKYCCPAYAAWKDRLDLPIRA